MGLTPTRVFSEQNELIQYARKIVRQKIGSLENDVKRCIASSNPYQPAPFPSLLFCFSVIDLLGALSAGNAKPGRTADQAKDYMQRFMNYTTDQADLLQKAFRHKLVHLAEPKPVMESKGRLISWQEWHDNREKHLRIESLKEPEKIAVTSNLSITINHVFHVGIWNLVEDVKASTERPDGYLHSLEKSTDLQDKFEQAIFQLYDCK